MDHTFKIQKSHFHCLQVSTILVIYTVNIAKYQIKNILIIKVLIMFAPLLFFAFGCYLWTIVYYAYKDIKKQFVEGRRTRIEMDSISNQCEQITNTKPTIRYKKEAVAVTTSVHFSNILVAQGSECEIEESRGNLAGITVMKATNEGIDYESLRRDEAKRKENEMYRSLSHP